MANEGSRDAPAYVSLLRGINVGGHKKILMADLRRTYDALGFAPVQTYIQSGNVVFRGAPGSAESVAQRIEEAIMADFGFQVRVMLRTAEELEDVVRGNPFLAEGADPSRLHVTFLAEAASAQAMDEFASFRMGPDELRLVGREAYLHCPGGMGRTKLTPTFIERSFGSPTTTRNWRTVNTVLAMARDL